VWEGEAARPTPIPFAARFVLLWASPGWASCRSAGLGVDPGPTTSPGSGSSSMATRLHSFQMFWSNLIRYVVLAAQIALAAGIAAIITMVLKYAIG
jgi:hypothetical protein